MARVAVTISLSDDERAELEALSRRRKTSQGLGGGLGSSWRRRWRTRRSPFVSRQPGHRGQVASPLCGGGPRRSVRRTPPRRGASNRRTHRGSGPADAGRDAAGRDPLEPSLDGAGSGHAPRPFIASAGLRLAAAWLGDLQAVERSLSWRRSATSSVCIWRAGSCPGSLCRRKEPDPGLDRSQPLLPTRPGQAERRSHDYKTTARPLSSRPSTSPRERSSAKVSAPSGPRVPQIPDLVEANVPADLDIHIVMDNYGTHKTKAIRDWFAKRPRWQAHFTPTSASWLKQVERWFGARLETNGDLRLHRSTKEPERTILDYIDTRNQNPKPFKWPNPPMTSSPPSSGSASEQSKPLNSRRKSCELRSGH